MKIVKFEITNFRLLENVSLDLEDDLSLVIGKNNCGKTSLLLLLDRFIGKKPTAFSFDDLNLKVSKILVDMMEGVDPLPVEIPYIGIKFLIFITYDKNDDLSNVGDTVLMDLDPENNTIVLSFEYSLTEAAIVKAKKEFAADNERRVAKELNVRSATEFFSRDHRKYFKATRKSVLFDTATNLPNPDVSTDLDKEKIKLDKILSFKAISARREVSNKETDGTLSAQSAEAFDRMSAANGEVEEIENFRDSLIKADSELNGVYEDLFKDIMDDIARFGGVKRDDTKLKVVSSLHSSKLLKDNTVVKYASGYKHHDLPESYNGLGYLNLISMIFELKAVLHEFSGSEETLPADINLLFIEVRCP